MPQVVLDNVGWTYLGLFIVWNVALAVGMTFLWQHRQLPSLRMRKIPLLLTGVFSLHIYGALCILAYPVGAFFSCTVEFWVMSIWLPFGIALFHAANSQFLHLASRQKHYAHMSVLRHAKSIDEEKAEAIANSRWRRVVAGLERADNINQTLIMIGVGLVIQVSEEKENLPELRLTIVQVRSHIVRLPGLKEISSWFWSVRLHCEGNW